MNRYLATGLALGLALFAVGCKEDKKGKDLGAIPLEPPVTEATPGALKITAAALGLTEVTESTRCDADDTDCFRERSLARLVARIFTGNFGCNEGAPEHVTGRISCTLYNVDSRLAELNRRAKDSARKCVDEGAKDHVFNFPAGITKTAKLQCAEDFDSGSSGLVGGFGFSGPSFHVIEVLKTGRISYGEINKETGDIEVILGDNKKISSAITTDTGEETPGNAETNGKYAFNMMHIKANKDANAFEVAIGASYALGTGVGCGVRLKSDGSFIYAKGIFGEPQNYALETDCPTTDSSVAENILDICLDANTLDPASDQSSCDDLKSFEVADITPSTFDQTAKEKFSDQSFKDKVTGFNVDAD